MSIELGPSMVPHLKVDDQDARPHGEKVRGKVLPVPDGAPRLVVAELGAVEGAPEEGESPDGGVVVERPGWVHVIQ